MTIDDFNAMNIHILTTDLELNNAIVGALQQMWQDVLGVKIKHDVQEYKVYLDTLGTQTPLEEMPHIWRMGWCADYTDENNWVHDVFNVERGGNSLRRNCLDPNCNEVFESEFDELTKAAALELDPTKRMEMYAEAESILAEQEVAYAPLYHSTKSSLTKPWLQRNYPLLGGVDIYDWKLDWGAKLAAQGK
jgi:oligopeptide transport system substrate-binding protein